MDIRIGDKVRFNQKGLDTPNNSERWIGIGPGKVSKAKKLGIGIVTCVDQPYLMISFQDPRLCHFFWPVEMFEKVPEEEKPEFYPGRERAAPRTGPGQT